MTQSKMQIIKHLTFADFLVGLFVIGSIVAIVWEYITWSKGNMAPLDNGIRVIAVAGIVFLVAFFLGIIAFFIPFRTSHFIAGILCLGIHATTVLWNLRDSVASHVYFSVEIKNLSSTSIVVDMRSTFGQGPPLTDAWLLRPEEGKTEGPLRRPSIPTSIDITWSQNSDVENRMLTKETAHVPLEPRRNENGKILLEFRSDGNWSGRFIQK